jgi:hypothetical protein
MKTAKLEIYKSQGFVFLTLITLIIAALVLLSGLSGCSNDNPMQSAGANNLRFSSASDKSLPGGNPQNILEITEAKVMIKDLKLFTEDDGNGEHEEEINIGPFVIKLFLDSKVTLVNFVTIPDGNYEKVKFKIHKLEENETSPDPDFIDAYGRYSVIVKGFYNGEYFVYKSKVSANQKQDLQKILSLTSNNLSNITFFASPLMWFTDNNGNILDPDLPFNRHLIDDNIRDNLKQHIRIFVDNDCDGKADY